MAKPKRKPANKGKKCKQDKVVWSPKWNKYITRCALFGGKSTGTSGTKKKKRKTSGVAGMSQAQRAKMKRLAKARPRDNKGRFKKQH